MTAPLDPAASASSASAAPVASAARSETPAPVIANVARIVTQVTDRITGDRAECPLLVATACVEGLKSHGIQSRVMYGQVAWIEVLQDHSVIWAGCWGDHFHFWVATEFGEVVDLNVSVAHRKPAHANPQLKGMFSPPILWSKEVPAFYRYQSEGVAEVELRDERDQRQLDLVLREVREKCVPALLTDDVSDFPNEAILCPGRRLLDDSLGSFKQFDRALAVRGVPPAPF